EICDTAGVTWSGASAGAPAPGGSVRTVARMQTTPVLAEASAGAVVDERLGDSVVDHAGADGDPGCFVDEDEGAGRAVLGVGVGQEGHGGAHLDTADFVDAEFAGVLVAVQGVDVEAVLDVLDQCPAGAGGVF